MNIKLIPTTEADRAFFVHVHHEAYRDTVTKTFGQWDEALQDGFADKAFDEGGMHIIWLDDTRVGVVGWDDLPDYLWLKELFILPAQQGQGIGRQIIEMFQRQAREAGKPLRLQTLRANTDAMRLYARCGFAQTEETPTHVKFVWQGQA